MKQKDIHPKDSYWFPHDANAHDDEKLIKTLAEKGWPAYGQFWFIVEILRGTTGYKLKLSGIAALAWRMRMDETELRELIDYWISEDVDLLVSDGEFFWSKSLIRRMQRWDAKREKLQAAGKKGAEQRWNKSDGISEDNSHPNSHPISEDNSNNRIEYNSTEQNSTEEKKSSRQKPPVSDEATGFAKWFLEQIRDKIPQPSAAMLQKWAVTYDELIRLDKRTKTEVFNVCKWALSDQFWGTMGNFKSPLKLRRNDPDGVKYYDVFLSKMKIEQKQGPIINGKGKAVHAEETYTERTGRVIEK